MANNNFKVSLLDRFGGQGLTQIHGRTQDVEADCACAKMLGPVNSIYASNPVLAASRPSPTNCASRCVKSAMMRMSRAFKHRQHGLKSLLMLAFFRCVQLVTQVIPTGAQSCRVVALDYMASSQRKS
jgi:hypothetical protein